MAETDETAQARIEILDEVRAELWSELDEDLTKLDTFVKDNFKDLTGGWKGRVHGLRERIALLRAKIKGELT